MIFLNGLPLPVTIFPDKTSQVWKIPEGILAADHAKFEWSFESEAEIMRLAQAMDLLKACGVEASLEMSYLPYGRQDKEVGNSATFALRTFASILNSMDFYEVRIRDPHSQIALDLINHSFATYPVLELRGSLALTGSDLVCYPDKGARTKYRSVYDHMYIYGEKVREQASGFITHYALFGDPDKKNVMIVDDICDGGATFLILAKSLIDAGAKQVNLFVTHGLFSKGTELLFESGIARIFTADGERKRGI